MHIILPVTGMLEATNWHDVTIFKGFQIYVASVLISKIEGLGVRDDSDVDLKSVTNGLITVSGIHVALTQVQACPKMVLTLYNRIIFCSVHITFMQNKTY